jgi:aminoglycoside 6'-N-acetyltransferase
MGGDDLTLRPMGRADFALLATWLARPHVAEWWGEHDPAAVEQDFGPAVDGHDPTVLFVGEVGGEPVGLVQVYRLADNPDYAAAVGLESAAGIDLFVADGERLGHGLGSRLIRAALAEIWRRYPEVTSAMAGPSVHNARSIAAFEKCGFERRGPVRVPGEADEEMVLVCRRPTAA